MKLFSRSLNLVRRRIIIRVVEPVPSESRRNKLLLSAFFRVMEGKNVILDHVVKWDPEAGCVEMLVRWDTTRTPIIEGAVQVIVEKP